MGSREDLNIRDWVTTRRHGVPREDPDYSEAQPSASFPWKGSSLLDRECTATKHKSMHESKVERDSCEGICRRKRHGGANFLETGASNGGGEIFDVTDRERRGPDCWADNAPTIAPSHINRHSDIQTCTVAPTLGGLTQAVLDFASSCWCSHRSNPSRLGNTNQISRLGTHTKGLLAAGGGTTKGGGVGD